MSETSRNEANQGLLQNELLKYLSNYLIQNRNRNRNSAYNLTTSVNRETYQDFSEICHNLGLVSSMGRVNITLEGLMQLIIENFRTQRIVQTTLFYNPIVNVKAEMGSQVHVDLSDRLTLKMSKKLLSNILATLKRVDDGKRPFWESKLNEVLAKAIKSYEKTQDPELEKLLKEAEKWI